MHHQRFMRLGVPAVVIAVVIAIVAMAGPLAAGQSTTPASKAASVKTWKAPRTSDGQPDLQGVWDFRNVIPLERPARFANKAVLTDQEAAEYEREAAERLDMDRRD